MKKKPKWLAPVAFLLLVVITVFVVSQQSKTFTAEGFLDYVSSVSPWALACAVVCMLGYILCEGLALLVICRALGYGRGLQRGLIYSAADIYFSSITPSATGGQPASALFMIGDGIPAAVTTVVLLLNLVFYTLSIFAVMLIGLVFYPGAFGLFSTPAHMMMVAGIVFQAILIVGLLLLIFSQKIFLRIVDLFLHLGQKLHLVKSAEKRREKLLEMEADYRASAGVVHQHIPAMLAALGLNVLQRVFIVLVPAVLYAGSGHPLGEMGKIFAIQSWVLMGSSAMPMPGAVGVADYLFLDGYGTLMPDPVNMELLSRTISFYSCVLICAVVLLVAFARKRHQGSEAG